MPKPTTEAEALILAIRAKSAPLTSCIFCDSTAVAYSDFMDDMSRREFRISRLCQRCQDEAFVEPEEDEV